MYELPIKDILPKHTQIILQKGQYSRLPQIYHNLSADPHQQKMAMPNNAILLSPWELLCFTLFKALATPSVFSNQDQENLQHFYTETNYLKSNLQNEEANREFSQVRMSKHRILVILIARLHRKLILQLKDQVNPLDPSVSCFLNTFCLTADEWLLQPAINLDMYIN